MDTEDLPLNISRETLRFDPRMSKIKATLTKKILEALTKKAQEEPEDYLSFWQNFGAILKEGFHEEPAKQEDLLPLIRLKTTLREGYISLDDYLAHMKEEQKDIYYLIGGRYLKNAEKPPT